MTTTLKFAVVGLGHIGKRHAEMVRRQPGCELIAGCDVRPKEELGIEEDFAFYSDITEMLAAHAEVDVGLHLHSQWTCMLHRLKWRWVRGIMLSSKSQWPSIVQKESGVLHKALEVGRQVFCVMQNRYSPPSIWLKETVESGVLGKIQMVQINCFWNRDDRYYGKIPWKGTADLDGGTLFYSILAFY